MVYLGFLIVYIVITLQTLVASQMSPWLLWTPVVLCVLLHLQERFWGSTLELQLQLWNMSSEDNLHNLTCEAENRAGPGDEKVTLDIECKCQWTIKAVRVLKAERLSESCHTTMKAGEVEEEKNCVNFPIAAMVIARHSFPRIKYFVLIIVAKNKPTLSLCFNMPQVFHFDYYCYQLSLNNTRLQ